MNLKKRICSLFLVLALCLNIAPFSVLAASEDMAPPISSTDTDTQPPEETPPVEAPEAGSSPDSAPEEETPQAPAETPAPAPTAPPVSENEAGSEEPEPAPPQEETGGDYVPGFTAADRGGSYAWPVPASSYVSQGYASGQHEALDIGADVGDEVLAAESGTVSVVQLWDGVTISGNQSYGNMIQIQHEDGNTTLYGHLSKILVAEGDVIQKGQKIGEVGASGNVTGPHLHFEVRANYGRINPLPFISGGTEEKEDELAPEIPFEDGTPVRRINTAPFQPRIAGDRGKLRILYNTFKSNVGHLPTIGDISQLPAKAVLINGTYRAAYCLQINLAANEGSDYTWSDLDFTEKRLIGDIMALGFDWQSSGYWNADSAENYKWAVTQLLSYAVMAGSIYPNTDGITVIPSTVDKDMETAASHSYNKNGFISYYQNLKSELIKLRQVPSFASKNINKVPAITLNWDGEKYTKTVTDTNGVLSRFNFTVEGVEIKASGNNLTLSTTEAFSVPKISPKSSYEAPGGEGATIIWRTSGGSGGTGEQDFVSYRNDTDPVPAYIKVQTDAVGSAGLQKISEDGIVSGMTFRITGSDGTSVTRTTDSSGSISLDGLPIYEVTTEEDPETGEEVEVQGERITYTATEVNVPIRYVIPQSQTFQLYEGQTTSLSFENRLKKWRVSVTKADRETGSTPQGDATLGGAKYGVYHNGVLQDTYTTDASGKFTTKYYVCGTGWTLRELEPSEGYLLNPSSEPIGMAPGETTVEYNSTSAGVKEQVIKGKVGITKHTDNGSTQIETPEVGAEFQVYLSASGSFDSAKASERDTIVIGENGYGETKPLPYGMYTVHQTKGWEGKEKVPDFQVFIDQDGKTYSFIINNRVFEALIQIVKKDAETGRVIPASGIGFKIKDLTTGKWVMQHINYPTPMDLDTFYTDVTGRLMLPSPLTYGDYELYEQQSAHGYVISKDPVKFTVDGTAKTLVVEMGNTPQKGVASIRKTGEVFSTVRFADGKYQPVYEVKGLAGAVYDLFAEEDIKTPDGTLRYVAGELVDTVTTGADGTASFKPVYLGKYWCAERTAPHGMVLDRTVYHIEFTYAGQDIQIIQETLDCYDERQKVKISLAKLLEQDEDFQIGMGGEYGNIRFGLFAAKDVPAADGTKLPKDGLIEEIGLSELLQGEFQTDLPLGSFYIRENAVDEHYLPLDQKYPVEFSYAGQETAIVRISLNDGKPIENTLIRGRIDGTKVDEDGLLLPGAVIGLFAPGTEEFTEETAILSCSSDASGSFFFENIPFGHWLLREIRQPEGFLLSDEVFDVEITEDGQHITYLLENEFIKGNVSLTKVDADYPDNKLSGAEFSIFADSNGNKEFDAGDVLIGRLQESEEAPGTYTMENLRYGVYFCIESKAPEYFVQDSTPRYFEIREHGKTVTISTNSKNYLNQPQTGSLKILKTSEDEIIRGRTFRVTGTALTGQHYSREFTTDENGEIFVSGLRVGSYTVSEIGSGSTVQYVLPPDQQVTIGYGDTATAEFYNRLKRGDIWGEKQDENGEALQGVIFGLFPEGTETFSIEKAVATAETSRTGKFLFKDVPYGKWLVKELVSLPGYVMLKEPVPVEIREDGVEVLLPAIVNEYTKVLISKQDITTGKELPGAKLQIIDADGRVVESWVSEEEPHLMERLPAGSYILHEESAPDGYLVAEDVKFVVKETGEIQKVVMKDELAPEPEVPNTGDNNMVAIVSGLLAFALVAAYIAALLLRRQQKKDKEGRR